jgi:hypothetical protein
MYEDEILDAKTLDITVAAVEDARRQAAAREARALVEAAQALGTLRLKWRLACIQRVGARETARREHEARVNAIDSLVATFAP